MEVTRQTPVRRLKTSGENGIDEDLDKIEVQAERVQYRGECGTNIIKGKAEKKKLVMMTEKLSLSLC